MANIIKQLPSKSEEILLLAYRDLIAFGKLFMPGDFMKSPTPPFHYEIGDELISDSNKPCAIIIPRGHAKYLRLDQNVLTLGGWKTVGELSPGDMVYGSDGVPKKITGFSDTIYKEDVYKVTTRDGRSLIVSGDHLWTVRVLNGAKEPYKYQTRTTESLLGNYKKDRYDERYDTHRVDYTYAIHFPAPIELPNAELPIDPYSLGVMLGDGSLYGTPVVTSHDDDIEEIMSYIPYDVRRRHNKARCDGFSVCGILDKIRELELDGLNSHNKYIPKAYLDGSVEQRLSLLRGLMDTDGTLATETSRGKNVYFCTVSERLADDFVYLVRSLGGGAIKSFHSNNYSGYYNIAVSISLNPFRLKRKSDRFVPHDRLFGAIVNIEKLDGAFCRCIKVDSSDELFVANDFILTHNTTLTKTGIVRDFCFQHFAKQWGLTEEDPMNLFYGWVSSNQKKSKNNVSYVRMHLKHNEKLHYYFGSQLGNFRVDNQEDIVTGYGDRLLSSSNLTSMRGDTLATIEKGALRYSRVFIDDAENEENTRTQNARDKIKDNIMNGIYPAIEKKKPGCRLFLIETPVHFDAFAQNILDKWAQVQKAGPEAIEEFAWKVITHKATQPDGSVLWPGYMSREVLDSIKQTYADSPRGIAGYYQEYELEVQNYETALWNRKHIKYHKGSYRNEDGQNILLIDGERVPVNTFIGCDPATDIETKNSDYSVIMAIAVDRENNVYVLEYERHRNIPTKGIERGDGTVDGKLGVVDYILDLYKKYNCKQGTVEDVAMNRTIFQTLNEVRRSRNVWDMVITPEKPGGRDKLNRIYSGLGSRFSAGTIYVRDSHFDLIDEILKFGPKMAHDDTIEALYYACKYAHPPRGLVKDAETAKYTKAKRKPKSWIVA